MIVQPVGEGPRTAHLEEIADGVFAYMAPSWGWGYSNAGLVTGETGSLVVDTLADLPSTAAMLEAMGRVTSCRPITTVVNTHAHPDHCWGNQLLVGDGVQIVASEATAAEMALNPPTNMRMLFGALDALDPTFRLFVERAFGSFDLDGIELALPTSTFEHTMTVAVGHRKVMLTDVGAAHTTGDTIAWLPAERVLFTGDILFNRVTPVVFEGPIGNWIRACDELIALDPAVIIPGHGPLATVADIELSRDYLELIDTGTRKRCANGMSLTEIITDLDAEIDRSEFAVWGDRERIAANVTAVWTELHPDDPAPAVLDIFMAMATYLESHQNSST